MRIRSILFACCLGILIGVVIPACTSSYVTVVQNKEAPFSAYKTYKIVVPKTEQHETVRPLKDNEAQAIHRKINQEMEKRNYKEDKSDPDLLITYHIKSEPKTEAVARTTSLGVSTGYVHRMGYATTYTTIEYHEYRAGTMTIDMIEASTKEVVWHGAASKNVSANLENASKVLESVTGAIMYKYRYKVEMEKEKK